jgi:hypothetical protein
MQGRFRSLVFEPWRSVWSGNHPVARRAPCSLLPAARRVAVTRRLALACEQLRRGSRSSPITKEKAMAGKHKVTVSIDPQSRRPTSAERRAAQSASIATQQQNLKREAAERRAKRSS